VAGDINISATIVGKIPFRTASINFLLERHP
jgi:hypothetical protein